MCQLALNAKRTATGEKKGVGGGLTRSWTSKNLGKDTVSRARSSSRAGKGSPKSLPTTGCPEVNAHLLVLPLCPLTPVAILPSLATPVSSSSSERE